MKIILANGTYPTGKTALTLLRGAEKVVCCDGAAVSFIEHGGIPDVIIGDMDSVSQAVRERFADRIVHVSEQDTNDLNKAFRYCVSQGWADVVILGATGKREDHTLGNISLLVDFAFQMPSIRMVTDDGDFFVATKPGYFEAIPGQEISLFALIPGTRLYSEGLQYPLNGLEPKRLWEATLNVATGKQFWLAFPEGKAVLVYRANL